jgi:hypothetical protein
MSAVARMFVGAGAGRLLVACGRGPAVLSRRCRVSVVRVPPTGSGPVRLSVSDVTRRPHVVGAGVGQSSPAIGAPRRGCGHEQRAWFGHSGSHAAVFGMRVGAGVGRPQPRPAAPVHLDGEVCGPPGSGPRRQPRRLSSARLWGRSLGDCCRGLRRCCVSAVWVRPTGQRGPVGQFGSHVARLRVGPEPVARWSPAIGAPRCGCVSAVRVPGGGCPAAMSPVVGICAGWSRLVVDRPPSRPATRSHLGGESAGPGQRPIGSHVGRRQDACVGWSRSLVDLPPSEACGAVASVVRGAAHRAAGSSAGHGACGESGRPGWRAVGAGGIPQLPPHCH